MNEKAIFEIGNIIHVRRHLLKRLSAKEISETAEFKQFEKRHPELCKLVKEEELSEEK